MVKKIQKSGILKKNLKKSPKNQEKIQKSKNIKLKNYPRNQKGIFQKINKKPKKSFSFNTGKKNEIIWKNLKKSYKKHFLLKKIFEEKKCFQKKKLSS